jgi:chromosome segregation ATPase
MQNIVFACLILTSVAWARNGQASVNTSSAGQSTEQALSRVRRQQDQNQAEVVRLKSDVSKQQADSEKASLLLERQDEAIAELRKQLQKLKSATPNRRH